MTQTANIRPRRLTPATAMIGVRGSVPFQISLFIQQRRARELKLLLDAAIACCD